MSDRVLNLKELRALKTEARVKLGQIERSSEAFKSIAKIHRKKAGLVIADVLGTEADATRYILDEVPEDKIVGASEADIISATLETQGLDKEARARLEAALAELREDARRNDPQDDDSEVQPDQPRAPQDTPVAELSDLSSEFRRLEVAEIAGIAGLKDDKVELLLKRVPALSGLNDQVVATFAIEGKLSSDEATRLGTIGGLAQLLGGQPDAVGRLADTRFGSLGGRVKKMTDLLRVEDAEMGLAILGQEVGTKDPEQAAFEASALKRRIEAEFPNEGLTIRLKTPKKQVMQQDFSTVSNILKGAPDRLHPSAEDDKLEEKERAALTAMRRTVHSYPGLELDKIVTSGEPAARIVSEIENRVAVVDKFLKNNTDVDFLNMDYAPDSKDLNAINFDGLSGEERQQVMTNIKARARTYRLTQNVEQANQLMQGGLYSAVQVGELNADALVAQTGMAFASAGTLIAAARDVRLGVTNAVGTLLDELRWREPTLPWVFLPEDVTDGLKKLTGYEDLFGSQSYCDCGHCDSILSPAAYFVDLMNFIETHVTNKDFTGAKKDHALNLIVRRPDLWTTELTCDNTHTLVPTLEIINEVLENALARRIDAGIDLSDRALVRQRVYDGRLAVAQRSFITPFDNRVASADRYITDFNTDRAEIMQLMRPEAPQAEANAAALGLSMSSYDMIITPRASNSYLNALYRFSFSRTGSRINAFDVQEVLGIMDISREAFGELMDTRYVSQRGAQNIRINASKRNSQSVQNDVEKVIGATNATMDRAHRFLRLQRALGWDTKSLDMAVDRMGTTLSGGVIAGLVWTQAAMERLNLSVEETVALTGDIPTIPTGRDEEGLMDKLFNRLEPGSEATPFPAPALRFVHPGLRDDSSLPETGPDAASFISQRLQLGLGLSEAGLLELIVALAPALGIDPEDPVEANRAIRLDASTLAFLYRHAVLADSLDLAISDLMQMIKITTGRDAVHNGPELRRLLEVTKRLEDFPFDLPTILALAGLNMEALLMPDDIAATLVSDIADAELMHFAPTVLAFMDGVSEDQSRAIIAANAGLFDAVEGDMLRLKANVGLTPTITAPTSGFPAGLGEGDIQAALEGFNIRTILSAQLAIALGVDEDKLDALLSYASVNLGTANILNAFYGGAQNALVAALTKLARPLAMLGDPAVTPANVTFLAANAGLFNLGANRSAPLTRPALMAMGAYVSALQAGDGTPNHATAVDAVLAAHTAANGFDAADMSQLALACGSTEAITQIFAAGMDLPDDAPQALDHLRRTVAFADDRGLGADAMSLLASSDPAALGQATESLISALHLKIRDADSFAAVLEGHEDALRGQRRTALVDNMIRTSSGRFNTISDIYNYYLIDPEMEGCARTSRVVSAIGSAQIYVQRILLNLEQDRRSASASNHVHVSPTRIPEDEWDWRKNYRVWEANRKVFLWPENYMQPSLRDNKTPQFEELEQTLLQQDLNEQTIQDAYAKYLKGFEEVANLKIAGAFHEHSYGTNTDVLHIFGCTAEDPPTYYYWTVENLVFNHLVPNRRVSYSARKKIDIALPSRHVSPIVYNNRLHLFWVEMSTSPNNVVEEGENKFRGYRHTLNVKFSALRLDGSWTAPQSLALKASGAIRDGGLLIDSLVSKHPNIFTRTPKYSATITHHAEYEEGYTLTASCAKRVYPAIFGDELYFTIGSRHEQYKVDLFNRVATRPSSTERNSLRSYWDRNINMFHIRNTGSGRRIHHQSVRSEGTYHPAPFYGVQDQVKTWSTVRDNKFGSGYHQNQLNAAFDDFNLEGSDINPTVAAINDITSDIIVPNSDWPHASLLIQKDSDVSLIHYNFGSGSRPYEARRLGTTLPTELSRTLFYDGVAGLLARETQKEFRERTLLVTSRNYRTKHVGPTNKMDFKGPLGTYYREIFMYIPALLAAHQNAKGDYASAQGWYAKVFDPTADFPSGTNLNGLNDAQRLQAERDRVWQYVEFAGLRPANLRDILTDEEAQETYRKDPFNPYAIARLRLSAFQKNIVMRYVDNLIDWADSLFRQFQRETVDEAHVLYDMARQILGPRPADTGDCGESTLSKRTYEKIKPHMEKGQDFLIEVETSYFAGIASAQLGQLVANPQFMQVGELQAQRAGLEARLESAITPEMRFDATRPAVVHARIEDGARGTTEQIETDDVTVATLKDQLTAMPAAEIVPEYQAQAMRYEQATRSDGALGRHMNWTATTAVAAVRGNTIASVSRPRAAAAGARWRPDEMVISVVRQVGPAFCVPRNKDLLELWDRVEDRLFKIHNCLNIDGERVDLALFAPEIDPNALVRARAAGLSLSDILASTAGNLPPYRFSYLVGKARDYVGLVQSLGSKLQSAIEKRDAEELTLLRQTHAANMQNLVTKIREQELEISKKALEEVIARQAAVDYRKGYYEGNLQSDLLPWERTQQILTHGSTIAYTVGAIMGGTSGVIHLIPQLGSPFAMKYGGHELGSSFKGWSKMFSDTAKMMEVFGKSASLEAKFERRRSGWKHQVKLDDHELKQIAKRVEAAEIRVMIAERALENHKEAIKNQEEILDFYESKFSGVELYTWLASSLQGIYRSAFNAAFGMAKLAEAAYRFERPHDNATLLDLTYWDAAHAGLLAGERLSVDLVEMEKKFIETNYRKIEIGQPFSVAQLDPTALMALKETGACDFTVPEFAFDLLYPGHYRRVIKAVRLSIACVTGPYVNIPATLMLTGSKIRPEPTTDGDAGLVDQALRHTVSITTSTAQSDAGVFDFSFADPRYMPFEGAGAAESQWRLVLPDAFRPFDYDTINDVILHVSYTAESDGVLRSHVDTQSAALVGALGEVLSATPLPRAISLRQEQSSAFHMLRTGPVGAPVTIPVTNTALPLPLQGPDLVIDRAMLLLKVADGADATGVEITLNGTTLSGFTALPDFPGYLGTSAATAVAAGLVNDHTMAISDPGALAPADPADTAAVAEGSVEEIVLYAEVSLA